MVYRMELIINNRLSIGIGRVFQRDIAPFVQLAFRKYPALESSLRIALQSKHFQLFKNVCGRKEVQWALIALTVSYIAVKGLTSNPAKNAWMGVFKWTISYFASLGRSSAPPSIPHIDPLSRVTSPDSASNITSSDGERLDVSDSPSNAFNSLVEQDESLDIGSEPQAESPLPQALIVPLEEPSSEDSFGIDSNSQPTDEGEAVESPRQSSPEIDTVSSGEMEALAREEAPLLEAEAPAIILQNEIALIEASILPLSNEIAPLLDEVRSKNFQRANRDQIVRDFEALELECQQVKARRGRLTPEEYLRLLGYAKEKYESLKIEMLNFIEAADRFIVSKSNSASALHAYQSDVFFLQTLMERNNCALCRVLCSTHNELLTSLLGEFDGIDKQDVLEAFSQTLQQNKALLVSGQQQIGEGLLKQINELRSYLGESALDSASSSDMESLFIQLQELKRRLAEKVQSEAAQRQLAINEKLDRIESGIEGALLAIDQKTMAFEQNYECHFAAEGQVYAERFNDNKQASSTFREHFNTEIKSQRANTNPDLYESKLQQVSQNVSTLLEEANALNAAARIFLELKEQAHGAMEAYRASLLLMERTFTLPGQRERLQAEQAVIEHALQTALQGDISTLSSFLQQIQVAGAKLEEEKRRLKTELGQHITRLSTFLRQPISLSLDSDIQSLSGELSHLQKLEGLYRDVAGKIDSYYAVIEQYKNLLGKFEAQSEQLWSSEHFDDLEYKEPENLKQTLKKVLERANVQQELSFLQTRVMEKCASLQKKMEETAALFQQAENLEITVHRETEGLIQTYNEKIKFYRDLRKLATDLQTIISEKHPSYNASPISERMPIRMTKLTGKLDLRAKSVYITVTCCSTSISDISGAISKCRERILADIRGLESSINSLYQSFPGLAVQRLHPVSSPLPSPLTPSQEMNLFLMKYKEETLTPALLKQWLDIYGIQYGQQREGSKRHTSWFRDEMGFSTPMIPFIFLKGDLDQTGSIQDIQFVFTYDEREQKFIFPRYTDKVYNSSTGAFEDSQEKTWSCYEVATQIYSVHLYLEKFAKVKGAEREIHRQVAFDLWKQAVSYADQTCTEYLENTALEQATESVGSLLSSFSMVSRLFCCCRRQKKVAQVGVKALEDSRKSSKKVEEKGFKYHIVYPLLEKVPKLLNITGLVSSCIVAPLCVGVHRIVITAKGWNSKIGNMEKALTKAKATRALSDIEHIELAVSSHIRFQNGSELDLPKRKNLPAVDALLASGQDFIDSKVGYHSKTFGPYEAYNVYQAYMMYGKALIAAKKYLQEQVEGSQDLVQAIDAFCYMKAKTSEERAIYDGLQGSIAFYKQLIRVIDQLISSDKGAEGDTFGEVIGMFKSQIMDMITKIGVHKLKDKYRQSFALSISFLASILAFGGAPIFSECNQAFCHSLLSSFFEEGAIEPIIKAIKYGSVAYTGHKALSPIVKFTSRFGDRQLADKMEAAFKELKLYPFFADMIETTGIGDKQLALFFNLSLRALSVSDVSSTMLDYLELALDKMKEQKVAVRGGAALINALDSYNRGEGLTRSLILAGRAALGATPPRPRRREEPSTPASSVTASPARSGLLEDPTHGARYSHMPTALVIRALFDPNSGSGEEESLPSAARRVEKTIMGPVQSLHGLKAEQMPKKISRLVTMGVMGSYILAIVFFLVISNTMRQTLDSRKN